MKTFKTYSEMSQFETYEERLEYLYIGDMIGHETFGNARWINQRFYKSGEWLRVRDRVILRDLGCDLGIEGLDLRSRDVLIHHINPITADDILNRHPIIFSMDNLIAVSRQSHNYIHFGKHNPNRLSGERSPNDTCPWKTGRR